MKQRSFFLETQDERELFGKRLSDLSMSSMVYVSIIHIEIYSQLITLKSGDKPTGCIHVAGVLNKRSRDGLSNTQWVFQ